TVTLNTHLCWIDAVSMVAQETNAPACSRGDLAGLCAGELLEELNGTSAAFDHWLVSERKRFNERLSALLQGEMPALTQAKADAKKRATNARRLIAFDPTHEGASRALMRALSDMGERAQALREYSRCKNALRKVLDVEPSPETRALCQAIRSFSGHDERRSAPSSPPRDWEVDARAAATRCGRLRVGVLPFLATRSKREENLAFSLSQEIAAGLARFRWFDVIAPVSLMHRRSATDASEEMFTRKELNYVVDGAVSRSGRSFQISVRLLDLAHYARP